MNRVCNICGKRTTAGNNVSHSKRRTKRTWKPNIIKIKLDTGAKIKVCTRCRKSLNKINSKKAVL